MGQCSNRGTDSQTDFTPCAVSLEKAKSLSSNAAVTCSRYHYLFDGGRQLSDDYEVDGKVLGQGLCGDVVLVHSRVDRRRYALKTIRKQQVSATKLRQLTSEVEIYLTLDHPNIARLHNVYESEADICLLTECCDGGELYFRLQKKGVYTDTDAAEAARQMLRAVGYLHSHHVVHRDLKLENFLYENEADTSPLKLIDFGFAKVWDPSTFMMASCGSIAYVSPDVLTGQGYTDKCDLWSLGIIVWMLLAGYPPFHGDERSMMTKIKAGQADWSHKSRWKPVSETAVDFVKQLLTKDPNQRPSAHAALKHAWLTRGLKPGAPAVLSRDLLRSIQRYANASKVRRAVLQLLAQELAPDETRELRETFLSVDRSNHGTICLRDLKDAIRAGAGSARSPERRRARWPSEAPSGAFGTPGGAVRNMPSPGADSAASDQSASTPRTPAGKLRRANSGTLDHLFAMLDANGDEKIYYSDFLAATMEARTRNRKEAVRATFARLDADGSGAIGVSDVRDVIGETFEGASVEDLIREADPEGRGEITFEAFTRVLEDRDATPAPTPTPHQRGGAGGALDASSRTPTLAVAFPEGSAAELLRGTAGARARGPRGAPSTAVVALEQCAKVDVGPLRASCSSPLCLPLQQGRGPEAYGGS